MNSLLDTFRATLNTESDPEVAKGMSQYFKGVLRFYGIRAKKLKALYNQFHQSKLKSLPVEDQLQFARKLLSSDFQEEKFVGIHIYARHHRRLDTKDIYELEELIDNFIYDWGSCDSLAGKVLSRAIPYRPEFAELVESWKDCENTWRQRCACIAFVRIARHGQFNDTIINICEKVVTNQERFAQLGVGWVLRELSLADRNLVLDFLRNHYLKFSREGLRYAIEKLPQSLRKEILSSPAGW